MKVWLLVLNMLMLLTAYGIDAKRFVETQSEGQYKVKVIIDAQGYEGFASLTENLPAGSEIEVISGSESETKVKFNVVSFLWLNLPATKTEIEYIVKTTDSKGFIEGKLGYVKGTNKETKLLAKTPFPKPLIAKAKPKENPSRKVEKAVSKPKVMVSGDTYYTVQIAAVVIGTGEAKFNSEVQSLAEIYQVNHEGMVKYLSGKFSSSKEANKHRKDLNRAGINGAWVVRYVDGVRR